MKTIFIPHKIESEKVSDGDKLYILTPLKYCDPESMKGSVIVEEREIPEWDQIEKEALKFIGIKYYGELKDGLNKAIGFKHGIDWFKQKLNLFT